MEARLAKALSHPTRLKILRILDARTASPTMLSREVGQPLANVSYHVKLLEDLGCIELVRVEQKRGSLEHHYRALRLPVIGPDEWTAIPLGARREIVDGIVGRVGRDLQGAVAGGGFDRGESHVTRHRLLLDEQAYAKLSGLLDELIEAARRLEAEAQDRSGCGDAVVTNLVALMFEHVEPSPPE